MLSWPWREEQHINILEALAFLVHLRHRSRAKRLRGMRFFHILDSRVATCVLAKGRSSSKRLNRVCRRVMAVALACDCYPVFMWTISGWNYSDKASRIHDPKTKAG